MAFDEQLEFYNDFTEKDKARGKRRKQDYTKAVLKYKKDTSRGKMFKEHPWYNNLHQYSKNKIHCSCMLCAFNAKKHGRIVFKQRTKRDIQMMDSIKEQLKEYKAS